MNKLSFKLETFEGPLDLLLHLIGKNKVSIYDIPIAKIADQYFEYIQLMDDFDLEISSEFIVLAADLLFIKSKMLIPKAVSTQEEEDPREELVQRLLEYKMYKRITLVLNERVDKYGKRFYKTPELVKLKVDKKELIDLSPQELVEAFNNIFTRRTRLAPPPKESFDKIIKHKRISIRAKAKDIIRLLDVKSEIKFNDVFNDIYYREEIIALFLAILELIKMSVIKAYHKSSNGQIFLKKNKSHVKGEYFKE